MIVAMVNTGASYLKIDTGVDEKKGI